MPLGDQRTICVAPQTFGRPFPLHDPARLVAQIVSRDFSFTGRMTAPLNLIGPQVRKFRTGKNWTQVALATKLQGEGWDVSRESIAKLEAQFRRAPDCELLFLSKVLDVAVLDLFPAKLNLKKLDRSLRLKVSTKYPKRKKRR